MSKDKDIYCGASNKLPRGKRFGTMRECVESNNIRRYGLFKVDSALLRAMQQKKIGRASLEAKLLSKRATLIALKGKKQTLIAKIKSPKEEKNLAKNKAEGRKVVVQIEKLIKEVKELKAKKEKMNEKAKPKSKKASKKV
jgi:hypothetical protein